MASSGAATAGGSRRPVSRRWRRCRTWLWRHSRGRVWYVIAALAVAALVLGWLGFWRYGQWTDRGWSWVDSLYRALQLFTLESGPVAPPVPPALQVARFLAPTVTTFGAIVAAFALFAETLSLYLLRRRHGHVVICGLGRKGLLLARAFDRAGDIVVAVDRDPNAEGVSGVRLLGIPYVSADARDPSLLTRVGHSGAAKIIAVTGDDMTNVEVVRRAAKGGQTAEGGPSFAHVGTGDLFDLLRAQESPDTHAAGLFNVYELGAWSLLTELPPFMRVRGAEGAPPPCVAVLGAGQMGMRLIIQLARSWSVLREAPDRRLRLVMVDLEATTRKDFLLAQYPQIGQTCDLLCHDLDVRSQAFGRGASLVEAGREPPAVVYVCFDNDEMAVATALAIRLHSGLDGRSRIVVIVEDEDGTARVLCSGGPEDQAGVDCGSGSSDDRLPAIVPFSLLERTCKPELLDPWQELVARAISNHYEEHLGGGLRRWRELSHDDREKNRDAAGYVPMLLAAIDCRMAHPRVWDEEVRDFSAAEVETISALEHERYRAWMVARGWTAGPKDAANKTNPSLVSWDDLDDGNREFTRSQIGLLPAALAQAGYVIVPKS